MTTGREKTATSTDDDGTSTSSDTTDTPPTAASLVDKLSATLRDIVGTLRDAFLVELEFRRYKQRAKFYEQQDANPQTGSALNCLMLLAGLAAVATFVCTWVVTAWPLWVVLVATVAVLIVGIVLSAFGAKPLANYWHRQKTNSSTFFQKEDDGDEVQDLYKPNGVRGSQEETKDATKEGEFSPS